MTERSGPWDGSSIGDATEAAYDAPTEFARFLEGLHGGTPNRGGVVVSKHSELAVSGVVTPVSVAAGWAYVYGTWYESDAAVSVAIPTPSVSTRIDRIVLRKSWAAQTVRVTRVAGVEGAGAPALVQIVGTTWDFPLAQASITTGGVITLTDQRIFIPKVGFNDAEGQPANISDVSADGTSAFPARRDHVHNAFSDAEGQPADLTDVSADGVSDFAARRDHAHNGFNDAGGNPTTVISGAESDGVIDFAARRDHQHHLGLLDGVAVQAQLSADFGAGTATIQWDVEIFDDNGMHAGAGSTLAATVAGKYLVGYNVQIFSAIGTINVTITLTVAGADRIVQRGTLSNGEYKPFSGSILARLTAGQTASITVATDAAGTRIVDGNDTTMFMQYVGD